ncbi:MAG: right-handed parallel beta-helix repeat-containing protein [Planctomycetota bacterium]
MHLPTCLARLLARPPLAAAWLALAPAAAAQIVYVDADLTTGANDGSSWADAFQGSLGLHTALVVVPASGEVWVTAGRYTPSEPGEATSTFASNVQGFTLRGGFAGGESSPLERPGPGGPETVLSGDVLGNDDGTAASTSDNCSSVLSVGASGAFAMEDLRFEAAASPSPFGGTAATLAATTARIERCSFNDNSGNGLGISLFLGPPSTVDVVDCTFARCGEAGLEYGLFTADHTLTVDRCLFEECGFAGLQIDARDPGTMVVRNSVLRANGDFGYYLRTGSGGLGTGLLATRIENCTIVDNQGPGVEPVASVPLWSFEIANTILWGNNDGGGTSGPQFVGNVTGVENLIVEGLGVAGVLPADAVFDNYAGGDFVPAAGSPAIDASLAVGFEPLAADFARARRAYDDPAVPNTGTGSVDHVDIGALERTPFIGSYGDCPAAANSTGAPGRVLAFGSLAVQDAALTLAADGLPQQQFGIFLASRSAGLAPMAGGGEGTLCLGGAIGRFNAAGQILFTGTAGRFSLPVDLDAVPQPSAFTAVQSGETWRFQAWHRDVAPGGGGTNQFTDSVALLFR